jgi:hypothetical protein
MWVESMATSRTKLTKDELTEIAYVVKKYLSTNQFINNRTLRSLTGIGYDQAIHFFGVMVRERRLEKIGQGSGTRYSLVTTK